MTNCKDIENNLPLYEDNLLSGAEKQAVEQHLKSCSNCAKALAQLQKVGRLVEGLVKVEPPPWFKQKIMSRVREEAEKKSLAQKWFYPLRIKIPVQIMATIVIAVLAVYIYRSGDEQMKAVLPPTVMAPVMETKKDQLSEQATKPSDADKIVDKEKIAAKKDIRDEKMVMQDLSTGSSVVKTRGAIPQENVRAEADDMAEFVKGDAAVDKREANYTALSGKQAQPTKAMSSSNVMLERKKEGYVLGASMKQSEAPAKQIIIPKTVISLSVANANTAVGEVEKILNKYEAKKIVKQTPDGKVFLTAEIKAQKIKDFIAQLKTIGRVEGGNIPADNFESDMPVVIEIVNN